MNKTISYKGLGIILSIVYFASYITRINFAAIISSVIKDTGYLKSDLSIILVIPLGLVGVWLANTIELCVRGILLLIRQITTKYYDRKVLLIK